MLTNEFIKEYKEMEGEAEQKYQAQQALIAAFAADQGTSVPSVRASLVKLNIYENKPKTTKVYKSDLVDQIKVPDGEAEAFAEKNKMIYIKTSAKTGDNVESAFQVLATKILEIISKQ